MSRLSILIGLLAATLGVGAWLPAADDAEPVAATARPRPDAQPAARAATPQTPAAPPAPPARPPVWPAAPAAALAAWSALPPAAPAQAASAPTTAPATAAERPAAPAFPYRWIGRLDDGGDVQALLASGDRVLAARTGDVIDGRWAVRRIDPAQLQLQWLPAAQAVTVALR